VTSSSEDALDQSLTPVRLRMDRMPKSALFVAGKVFCQYRSIGGARANVLPDFFIGAQARVASLPILTRDARRYRTYFSGYRVDHAALTALTPG
jgi:predicted nucleic acid-binding protein